MARGVRGHCRVFEISRLHYVLAASGSLGRAGLPVERCVSGWRECARGNPDASTSFRDQIGCSRGLAGHGYHVFAFIVLFRACGEFVITAKKQSISHLGHREMFPDWWGATGECENFHRTPPRGRAGGQDRTLGRSYEGPGR